MLLSYHMFLIEKLKTKTKLKLKSITNTFDIENFKSQSEKAKIFNIWDISWTLLFCIWCVKS